MILDSGPRISLISFNKKPKVTKRSDNSTISLFAYTAKTAARTLKRTKRKMEDTLGEDQLGFCIGKGIREATGMLRTISE